MLKPTEMQQMNILVFREDVDAIIERIAEIGVVHLTDSSELKEWGGDLSAVPTAEIIDRLEKCEKKIRDLAQWLGIGALPRTISSARQYMNAGQLEQEEKRIAEIETELRALLHNRDSTNEEIEKLLKISGDLKLLAPLGPIGLGARTSFLQVETGRIRRKNLPLIERALAGIPHAIMSLGTEKDVLALAVISLKKDAAVLSGALRDASCERITLPAETSEISEGVEGETADKVAAFRRTLAAQQGEIAAFRRRHERALKELAERINCTKLLSHARTHFRKTASTWLITGWIPAAHAFRVSAEIERMAKGRCYIEVRSPIAVPGVREGRVKVPVLLRNPIFVRPFELLTSTYGIPAYNTIDPTLFVAITFLIMFGVMFGDIGDGLVLALLGGFLAFRGHPVELRRIGTLILYGGISSLIFGFLYGSFFGVEDWFAPLWISPMHNVLYFITTALYFGIAMVSLGILINIINALMTRDWIRGIFDKAGLLAGVVYWGCIGLVIRFLVDKEGVGINRSLVIAIVGVPILLLFMKAPGAWLMGKSAKLFPEGVLTYFMEMLIEVVEIFLGFLANTLSFIRVAAFGLAHAMLFIAVFALVDAVRAGTFGTVISILLILLGNIVIIVLEGLIVTIQAMRLEYYEFFGKFFTAEGERYAPIKIG
ncbi:MAG: hypothetical protein NTZ78_08255 [Candidatus Aureabacteria bacterium]|nr:hypothetical protein [Candidatus Auribacterota bacterium]